MRSPALVVAIAAASLLCASALPAQSTDTPELVAVSSNDHFGPGLLSALRRAAELSPGDKPVAVRVLTLAPGRGLRASMVEGAGPDSITAGYPVFQIQFRTGSIVVDPTVDRSYVQKSRTFSDRDYAAVQQAMRSARMVLLTHEHPDHIAALLRSPYLAEIRPRTLLTRAQLRTLVDHPMVKSLAIDSASAASYPVIDYDPWIPIAPGVVLLKAAGHTPGSQMIYIRTARGQELILSGDVAWHTSGITGLRPKPARVARTIGEDMAAVGPQLTWLKDAMAAGVSVVVSHDQDAIREMVRTGVLKEGLVGK